MLMAKDCTQPLWEKHLKELKILFFNQTNEKTLDFLFFTIKICSKKINLETALVCTKFLETQKFSEIYHRCIMGFNIISLVHFT